MVKISVIIPTYNRCEALRECLKAYQGQSIPGGEFEVVVVDDGSTDRTGTLLEELAGEDPRLRHCRQPHAGPAAARNRGLKLASGRFVLFTGDDIVPEPGFLARHLDTLEKKPGVAVVGLTGWDEGMEVTDFMRFLDSGHQFAYGRLRPGEASPWQAFYCSNVSLERRWLETELFDENFRYPAWEDLELGYRLCRQGLRIVFDPQAVARHRHIVTEDSFYAKARQAGYSRVYFFRKHGMRGGLVLHTAKSLFIVAAAPVLGLVRFLPGMKRSGWDIAIRAHAAAGFLSAARERV